MASTKPITSVAAQRRTHVRPRRGWAMVDFGGLWQSRDLLWMFVIRDIKVQYKQTFFGFAWAIVVPFVQIVVFTIFFGQLLGVGDRVNEIANRNIPYPLFALSGQVIWNCFSTSAMAASTSLLANAAIIRKVYVPRLVLPIANMGKPAINAVIALLFMHAVAFWYSLSAEHEVVLSAKLFLTFPLLALSLIPALGLGMLFASVTVFYRDLKLVLPFFIQILFYLTPVIYPAEILPEQYRWLIYLNPIVGFVDLHRAVVLSPSLEAISVDWWELLISLLVSAVILVAGSLCFTRAERYFADVA